jgi:hypothetical protein
MLDRLLGPSGARGRRVRRVVPLVAACVFATIFVSAAQAVHDLAFQLDGDVSASTTTNVGGSTQTVDWDSLFNASGGTINPLPTGFTAATFTRDFRTTSTGTFATSDNTTFTTGSKDTLNITPGWQCAHSANVNSKIDLMNAYATSYTAPSGDSILYFGLERNDNSGDGNVGFWFLQDPTVGCSSASGTKAFTGNHEDGDLLVVSAFTNGGSVSTITVYKWVGGASGHLDTNPVANGVDCKTTGGNDTACATVNGPTNGTGGTITTPWLTSNKQDGVGHSLRESEFFEGGLNLTQANLAGHCFNTFMTDTRSSQSLTATLFDYTLGTLGECTSATKTTPSIAASSVIPASGTISGITDSAQITVTGVDSFNSGNTNNVHFFLCGPLALNSTSTCTTGGAAVGDKSIQANGSVSSDPVTITSVGRYCFRAVFDGDPAIGVPGSSDSTSSECFKITPRTPALATNADASPVPFGNPVSDTAHLSNTANEPGTGGLGDGSINPTTAGSKAQGTITFKLFGPDPAGGTNCTTLAAGFPSTGIVVNVNGDGAYNSGNFTPTAPGVYHWVAVYSGDPPNTNGTSHNTACTDTNENVLVQQIPSTISTGPFAYPNDSATIASSVTGDNLPAGGTVTFRLYGPAGGNTGLQNCQAHTNVLNSGGLIYRQTFSPAFGTAANSKTFITTNTTVSVNDAAATTYYWYVTYSTGDTAHTGRQSNCVENQASSFTADAGPGTLFP